MAEIYANWKTMALGGEQLESCSAALGRCKCSVEEVRRQMNIALKIHTGISGNLSGIERELIAIRNGVKELKRGLTDAAYEYRSAEDKILGRPPEIKVDDKFQPDLEKLLKDVIGKFGAVGTFTHAIWGVVDPGDNPAWLTATNFIKDSLAGLGETVKAVEDTTASWAAKLFGFKLTDPPGTFAEAWGDEWGKYAFSSTSTTGEKIAVGARWVGVLATVAGNAYGNWKEYQSGDITASRAIQETILESGIDIVTDVAIKAALAAAFGAVPAVAVAAGAVVVKWGLDTACEYFFDKDLSELATDAIIDFSEGLQDFADASIDKLRSGWDAFTDNVSAGWKRCKGLFA